MIKQVLAFIIVVLAFLCLALMVQGSGYVVIPENVADAVAAQTKMLAGLKQYFQGFGLALIAATVAYMLVDRPDNEQEEVVTKFSE